MMVSALAVLFCLGGCKGIKQISVSSFEIVSIAPRGMNEIDALVKVGINNPTVAFEVTDLSGTVFVKDSPCLTLTSDQLIVYAKSDRVYSIPVHGTLEKEFNPFQLLQLFNNQMNLDDVTLNVKAKAALRGGAGKVIDLKGIPLSRFIKDKENVQ